MVKRGIQNSKTGEFEMQHATRFPLYGTSQASDFLAVCFLLLTNVPANETNNYICAYTPQNNTSVGLPGVELK